MGESATCLGCRLVSCAADTLGCVVYFFLVVRGDELRFVAGFGKGRDKLGGGEMGWHWASGMR